MTTVTSDRPVYRMAHPTGYCQTGHHDRCPGRINAPVPTRQMKGGTLVKVMVPGQLECPCTDCLCSQKVHCLDCKHVHADDVDPQTWSCLDRDACLARREVRMEANPVIQMIRSIERNRAMSTETTEKTPKAPAKPKVGNCLCCGDETKGGKFLPGHDARFVSEQVAFILQGSKTEAKGREALADTSDSLKGKFEKSLGLAREKAAKKVAAEKEKSEAAAKAEVGAEVVAKADAATTDKGKNGKGKTDK